MSLKFQFVLLLIGLTLQPGHSQTTPAKMAHNPTDNVIYAGNYGASSVTKIKAYEEVFEFEP
ncbi:MAG: hypothetical protein KDC05_14690, partial [Bacteroidales bacterium]|nr:hypothetical protein [Bacteroidales bacterium]